MTVPLGNTPNQTAQTPDELQTKGLVWMGEATKRGEPPVIVFYRTIEHGAPFAPKATNIDPATGRPRLVHPVTVDLYFPNGPLAGRVYRRIGFINAGIAGPARATAVGSINVGQLGIGQGPNGPYAQLNALDQDALDWASKIHQAAGGDVFAFHGGEPSTPVAAPTAEPPAATDRFAGMPVPGQGAAPAPQGMPQGQPAPTGMAPPPGVPNLGGPPPGMPGAAAGGQVPPAPPAWAQGQA